MSLDIWRIRKGLCRCCHAEGSFKSLAESNTLAEVKEVFYSMLRQTLNIDINPVAGFLCVPTYRICDKCISRLHDATSFRKQIVKCEEKFHVLIHKHQVKGPDIESHIKTENDTGIDETEPDDSIIKSDLEEDNDDDFDWKADDENVDDYNDCDIEEPVELERVKKKPKRTLGKAKPRLKRTIRKNDSKKADSKKIVKQKPSNDSQNKSEDTIIPKARSTKSRKAKLLLKSLRKKRRYQELKNDPEKYALVKEKERIRYLKRKEQKKIKSIADMTPEERRIQRKRWLDNSLRYAAKKKAQRIIREFML